MYIEKSYQVALKPFQLGSQTKKFIYLSMVVFVGAVLFKNYSIEVFKKLYTGLLSQKKF